MKDKALGIIGIARKAGKIIVGDPILEEVRRGRAAALLIATDAADNTRRRAKNWSLGGRIPIIDIPYDKETFGAALGRVTCAMALITDEGLLNELRTSIKSIREAKEDTQ